MLAGWKLLLLRWLLGTARQRTGILRSMFLPLQILNCACIDCVLGNRL